MKRSLFYLFLIFCLGCKRNNSPAPTDITGTWKITSYSGLATATYTDFPCLEDNLFTISANGTATEKYTGSAPCALSGGLDKIGVTVGSPGQATSQITWTRNGNNINFMQVSPVIGTPNFTGKLSYVNGTLTLTTTYTDHVFSSTIISTETWIKQ